MQAVVEAVLVEALDKTAAPVDAHLQEAVRMAAVAIHSFLML